MYIRCAWENGAFLQCDAADELKVNQGQISKIIGGHFKRPSGHAARLFEYAKRRLTESENPDASQELDNAQAVRNQLVNSLFSAWDGTTRGAEALIEILNGARQLSYQGKARLHGPMK